jgi:nucleotide-binding universal stress UspA family protein
MYERILAAIDLTPNENDVLSHTQQIAKLTGAAVLLLHIAPLHIVPGDITGGAGLGAVSGVDPRDLTLIDEAVAQLTTAGIPAKGEMLSGTEHDIADVIVRRAKEFDAKLVILGETLHRGASKLFRTSVVDDVVHAHPECPILLVP